MSADIIPINIPQRPPVVTDDSALAIMEHAIKVNITLGQYLAALKLGEDDRQIWSDLIDGAYTLEAMLVKAADEGEQLWTAQNRSGHLVDIWFGEVRSTALGLRTFFEPDEVLPLLESVNRLFAPTRGEA